MKTIETTGAPIHVLKRDDGLIVHQGGHRLRLAEDAALALAEIIQSTYGRPRIQRYVRGVEQ